MRPYNSSPLRFGPVCTARYNQPAAFGTGRTRGPALNSLRQRRCYRPEYTALPVRNVCPTMISSCEPCHTDQHCQYNTGEFPRKLSLFRHGWFLARKPRFTIRLRLDFLFRKGRGFLCWRLGTGIGFCARLRNGLRRSFRFRHRGKNWFSP